MLHILHGDVCSLLCLIAILAFVGHKMLWHHQQLYLWGWRFATAAFLGYCIYAGFALRPSDAAAWLRVVLRALLAAGLTLAISWILSSVIQFAFTCIFAVPLARVRALANASRQRQREQQQQQFREEEERRRSTRERERNSNERQQAATGADTQRRRTDARASVELEYTRLAAQLGAAFTREMLTAYFNTYMSDQHSPEHVERRGRELIATLQRYLQEAKPPEGKMSFEQLDSWFQAEKQRIESSSADQRLKRIRIAALIRRHAEWSPYVVDLLENLQRTMQTHMTTEKLRFLLYPSGLTPHDEARIREHDAGVIWL